MGLLYAFMMCLGTGPVLSLKTSVCYSNARSARTVDTALSDNFKIFLFAHHHSLMQKGTLI